MLAYKAKPFAPALSPTNIKEYSTTVENSEVKDKKRPTTGTLGLARPKTRSIYQERMSRNTATMEAKVFQSTTNNQSGIVIKRRLGNKKKQFLLN